MTVTDFRVQNGVRVPQATSLGVGSANYVQVAGASTGNRVTISALGSDTNIGINLVTKGTGTVTINGSPITVTPGGTNGQIQFNNNGVFGGYPTTGTAGSVVLNSSPTVIGGTFTALTGFSLHNAGTGSFNAALAYNGTLTQDVTLNLDLVGVSKSLSLGGSLSISGGNLTLIAQSGGSSITFPTSGTVATLTGTETLSNKTVLTAASTTGGASFRLPPGTAPTTPTNGDIWATTTNIQAQVNNATKTIAFADGLSTSARYALAATGNTASWIKVGTFNAGQSGRLVNVKVYAHSGYNATNNQDVILDIFFKTSNGTSLDVNGFSGNSWYTTTGASTTAITDVKWVGNAAGSAATTFTLYLNAGTFTDNSIYEVVMSDQCSWTDGSATNQTDPGAASTTVCISSNVTPTGSGGGNGNFTASDTPPSNPAAGDRWLNTSDSVEYTYYNDGNTSQWVDMSGGALISVNAQVPAYLSPTQPTDQTPYIWFQTGLGPNGTGVTIWVNS